MDKKGRKKKSLYKTLKKMSISPQNTEGKKPRKIPRTGKKS
jgi:hypothetical protein